MIEIINSGLMATLQGKSYKGHRHIGMPLSGPADPIAMAIANKLANNPYDSASIEFSILGGMIKAHDNICVGIAGAIGVIALNDDICPHYQSIMMKSGDILSLKPSQYGAHIYVSVHGGFISDHHWNGNSTFLPAKMGGYKGRALKNGDILSIGGHIASAPINIEIQNHYRPVYGPKYMMRICSENNIFDDFLTQDDWTVGRQSNRIGYELNAKHDHILSLPANQSSRPVYAGTIQYLPSGKAFLLGVDAQTTGGYPIIGHVIRADRHIMGQIKSGDSIKFIKKRPCDARKVYLQKLKMWKPLITDLILN